MGCWSNDLVRSARAFLHYSEVEAQPRSSSRAENASPGRTEGSRCAILKSTCEDGVL